MFRRNPRTHGVQHGRLAACPASLNCVSSQATDRLHHVEPLTYAGSADDARQRLRTVIESLPRARIVTRTENSLHVEFSTRLWRFVDDVEFLFDDSTRTIHVRSAARLGYFDFGVNRRRVERIRRLFDASVKE